MLVDYAGSDDAKERSKQLGEVAQAAWTEHGDDIVQTGFLFFFFNFFFVVVFILSLYFFS